MTKNGSETTQHLFYRSTAVIMLLHYSEEIYIKPAKSVGFSRWRTMDMENTDCHSNTSQWSESVNLSSILFTALLARTVLNMDSFFSV